MWEVFQGHLDPSRATWSPHVCFGHIWSKITKLAVVKIFRSRSRKNQFFILKYGPKPTFCCNMRKIWGDSFWEIALFWIPYFGRKRPFFGPETEILAQNFKNIVTCSARSYLGPKKCIPGKKNCPLWKLEKLGSPDPPKALGAPGAPQGGPGGQKWPKSSLISPVMRFHAKKSNFKGVGFFFSFFTRNDPPPKHFWTSLFRMLLFYLFFSTAGALSWLGFSAASSPSIQSNPSSHPLIAVF